MKSLIAAVVVSASVAISSIASAAMGPMAPMDQIGPQPREIESGYAQIVKVSPDGQQRSIAGALGAIGDASAQKRYAVLCAAGTYKESHIALKPYVDLYGGFASGGGDWKTRDVYANRTI